MLCAFVYVWECGVRLGMWEDLYLGIEEVGSPHPKIGIGRSYSFRCEDMSLFDLGLGEVVRSHILRTQLFPSHISILSLCYVKSFASLHVTEDSCWSNLAGIVRP